MHLKTIFLATLFIGTAVISGCSSWPKALTPASILMRDPAYRAQKEEELRQENKEAELRKMQSMLYISEVDSLAKTDADAKKRYVLLPGGKGVDAGDLQFQEFAAYVKKILVEKGFVEAETVQDADVAIFLGYAIGDPQTYQYTYSIPTWGQTGVASVHTSGTVSSYGSRAHYSGTTMYTPTYGDTGSTTHIETNTVYTRFLFLDAYDVQTYIKENRMAQVWKTTVVSTGSNDDLRLVFPFMAVAMKPYLGINTGRKIRVEVRGDDPAVLALRGGQPSGVE